MSRVKLNRRTLLKGMLGGAAVSIALPPLEIFLNTHGTAWADGAALPRRFGVFWWGNGVLPTRWIPTGEGVGSEWELSEQLAPFAPIKHKIAVVSGTEVKVPNVIPHTSGACGLLAGMEPLGEEGADTFSGPTIDQIIAAEVGGNTRFRSLQTAVDPGRDGVSWNGPFSENPAENSPHALFERLFGAGFTAPGEAFVVDPKLALRRSVLDVVTARTKALQSKLGSADKARLDQHLTSIRDIENRLVAMASDPPDLAACERLGVPADLDYDSDIVLRHHALTDLMVMALACDQTRVFTYAFSGAVNSWSYPGTSENHHSLTHNESGEQPEVHSIVVRIMEQYSYFLQAMDAVQEGDGTLLDNSLVLGSSEISYGKTHALDEMPLLIGGSACGALKSDIHYRSQGRESSSKVLLSAIRAMGIPRESWGTDDVYTVDGLGAIES
jgi:hypothetical protein